MKQIQPDVEAFARIRVIGVGGSGKNAINHMISSKVKGVEFIVVNTDAQDLHHSLAKKKIHIGKNLTRGLGTGMNPEIGKQAAEENKSEIPEEQIVENITSNETEESQPEEVINITVNETFIPQENATIPEADINQSPETSNEPPAEVEEPSSGESLGTSPQPEFDIKISYPGKITRGEIIELNADITHIGTADVKNVLISWILPEGFEIAEEGNGKSIFSGKTYNSKIKVQTSTNSVLGLNQIKILVSYDE